ncbi:MAG: O-antigen ligase family protein [Verrucomicrobiota bacterium]|nr:O-antigen ligase family protein [Verrucomicrobiota bacterium]
MTEEFSLLLASGLIHLLFAGGYMFWNLSKLSLEALMVGYTLYASLILVEIDFGPASPRVWMIFLLFAWAIIRIANRQYNPQIWNVLKPMIIVWFFFTIWTNFCDFGHGRVDLNFQVFGYLNNKLSKFAVPIMACISFAVLLKRANDIRYVIFVIISTIVASVFVAYLQFFDLEIGWEIHRKLRPITVAVEEILKGRTMMDGHITGLSGRSVQFAYTLITFGIFSFSYVLIKERGSKIAYWLGLLAFGCIALAAFLAKSRSGMLAFVFSGLAAWVLPFRLYSGFRPHKTIFGIFMLGAALFAVLLVLKGQDAFKYENFDRMGSFDDRYRIYQAQLAVESTIRNPVIGIGIQEYTQKYELPPHNLFLNAMVYYGVPGLLFSFAHIIALFFIYKWYKREIFGMTDISWISFGCILAMFNYTWNSMTHNDSFITGGTFLYYIIGIFAASAALELMKEEDGRQALPYR